jgi:hypothetical protein
MCHGCLCFVLDELESRADERQKLLAEVEGWADENQMSPFANLGSTKYVRYAKLRAKLGEMKGEK